MFLFYLCQDYNVREKIANQLNLELTLVLYVPVLQRYYNII